MGVRARLEDMKIVRPSLLHGGLYLSPTKWPLWTSVFVYCVTLHRVSGCESLLELSLTVVSIFTSLIHILINISTLLNATRRSYVELTFP